MKAAAWLGPSSVLRRGGALRGEAEPRRSRRDHGRPQVDPGGTPEKTSRHTCRRSAEGFGGVWLPCTLFSAFQPVVWRYKTPPDIEAQTRLEAGSVSNSDGEAAAVTDDVEIRKSKFHFVDLAGSERAKRTVSTQS